MNEIQKVIFKCRVGSHLYGLSTENSDEDFISVFLPKPEYIIGLKRVEVLNFAKEQNGNHKDRIDDQMWSLEKFIRLLLKSTPNAIEILFASKNNILIEEKEFSELKRNYDKIVSKSIVNSFGGYATAQSRMLRTKRDRYVSLLKAFDFIESLEPDSRLSEYNASKLNSIVKYYKGFKGNTNNFHKGMEVSMIKENIEREIKSYGKRIKGIDFSLPKERQYDAKFAYHSLRLLIEAKQLLKNGRIDFPFSGKDRELLIKIRNQEIDLSDIFKLYEVYFKEVNEMSDKSKLISKPDFHFLNSYLIKVNKRIICETS